MCEEVPQLEPSSPHPSTSSSHSHKFLSFHDLPKLSHFPRSRTPSPEPALAPIAPPPVPRRLAIFVLGLKPHRKLWTTSARPSESVIQYQLLNGCPAIVLPAKLGTPLIAWNTLALDDLWKIALPVTDELSRDSTGKSTAFEGTVNVLYEYVDLCVEWERVVLPEGAADKSEEAKKSAVRDGLALVVAAAIRTGSSKEVKKEVDKERCGIVFWRIP